MISLTFSGPSVQEVLKEASQFIESISSKSESTTSNVPGKIQDQPQNEDDYGYRPSGVGQPIFAPVDDGTEWDETAINDWVWRLNSNGRKVIATLARGGVIDPRSEAKRLGITGTKWAGIWTSPRKQANQVSSERGINSWPYGHTYDEPRKLWMHPSIAERVLKALEKR